MSFSSPIQWYHSHADPIWPTVPLNLQSLFGLHVHSCTHWPRPRNIAAHLHGSNTRALLVSQDRRHFFVTSDLRPQKYAK
jgi:hypothetical protein